MRAVDLIRKKRDGGVLGSEELSTFVDAATTGAWPPYQVSALLMAIYFRGMTPTETAEFTQAMVQSGSKLDWSHLPGPTADKHSTGGVGDKTSLILAPVAAACCCYVPMMSGRGLGHTGGTLDKLESIPGFRVDLSLEEMRSAVARVGCALIGQTAAIAPADKVLYALRDVTGTVESIPLISASIMSKKIAEGIDGLALDVKSGSGAFMKKPEDATCLARSLVDIGTRNGVATEALLTRMDVPLGLAIGNALEVIECIDVLKGHGPEDVTRLSLALAARMLRLAGIARSDTEADIKVGQAIASGRALEKFREIIAWQGGDPNVIERYDLLPTAPNRTPIHADRAGFVTALDAEGIGRATMVLGAGRDRVEDRIDHAVGARLLVRPGDRVQSGAPLLELHWRDEARLGPALDLVRQACKVGDAPPEQQELVFDTIWAT